MSYFKFLQSHFCPNHGDTPPDRFYLKTGVKDLRTKGQTYFICSQNGCQMNTKIDQCPLYECPKHVEKSIELQYVECGRKISVRCSESKNWCHEMKFNETNANLKVFKPLADVTNTERAVANDKPKPAPFLLTSTPKVTSASAVFAKPNPLTNNRLLQNFESSGDCSSFSQSLEKSVSDVFDEKQNSSDAKESDNVENIVDDSDDSQKENDAENVEPMHENSSVKVIRLQNKSRDVTIVVDNSSDSVNIVVDSPSKNKAASSSEESNIASSSQSNAASSPECYNVVSAAVRPKMNRIRFNDSSKDSIAYDQGGGDRSRSVLLTNKEKLKNAPSDTKSFTQIREAVKRIESSDSEADGDDEDDGDEIEDKSETKPIAAAVSPDASSNKIIDIVDSDSSFEIPSSLQKEEGKNDIGDFSGSSDDEPVELPPSPKATSSQFEMLAERLNTLLAAKRRAGFLPDGGARLDAKIEEVRQEIRRLDFSPMAARKYETNPFTQMTNAALEMQAKNLFATDNDQRAKLYGGRMNVARKMEVRVVTNDAVEELHNAVTNIPSATEETEDPKGLIIPLMRHQRQALTWLKWRENKRPPGGILADDMGLGKTLTMISLVLCNRVPKTEMWKSKKLLGELVPSQATLVICPTSLLYQWENEIKNRVKPGFLNTLIYHGPRREISAELMSSYDFVISPYGTVASEVGDGDERNPKKETKRKAKKVTSVLLKIGWERIILDEAHIIKNPNSLTSKACCRLPAAKRWVLTGTPIHNCLKDMYALLKFLRCEPFDEWEVWKRWIENKSEIAKERLNAIIKAVMLRRTKNQICSVTGLPLVVLPPKKLETHEIDLFALERKVYDRLFEASKRQVAEFVRMQEERDDEMVAVSRGTASYQQYGYKNPFLPRKLQQSEKNGGPTPFNQSHILVLLLRLRQACTHLALMKESVDIDAFDDENIEENLVQKLTDMSLFEQKEIVATTDSNVEGLFEQGYISTKLKLILDQIDAISQIRENGEIQKMVVVSQWAKLLDIVGIHLGQRKIPFTFINGSVKAEDRSERVEKFNDRKRGPVVMLLSLTAGGVGLNLIGGNHLFLVDMHWNPALEQQACDRIYRMGQTRNVFIHKFLCKKTIEEKVFALQNQKCSLAEAVITGAGKVANLSKDDLKFLFGLNETTASRRYERK